MRFTSDGSVMELQVTGYEFPPDGGQPKSDDRNWLVVQCTFTPKGGKPVSDSNSCLLTYELREMTAGLKVLLSGAQDHYECSFVEPYLDIAMQSDGQGAFWADISFFLPHAWDAEDTADIQCTLSPQELNGLVEELESWCAQYPDRA